MSKYRIKPWLVAAGGVLFAAAALANEGAGSDNQALKQELDQAREQLNSAAERVAELSKQLGEEAGPMIIRRIERGPGSKRPMLGVVLGGDEQRGVRLQAVTPDGPAAKAGLESGDVVTAINGQAIAGADARARLSDARERLAGLNDGQVVQLDFERDGHPGRADVTAKPISAQVFISGHKIDGIGPDELNIDLKGMDIDIERIRADVERSLGDANLGRLSMIAPMLSDTLRFDAWRWQRLRLAELDPDLGRYFGTSEGVLVLKPEGDGERDVVLRSGDVILTVAGEAVTAPGQVMRKLADAEPGQPVALSIMRDRSRREVTMTAPDRPNLFDQFGAPPAPPTPPAPPAPPSPPDRALPTPPAPPAPPAPPERVSQATPEPLVVL